MTNLPDNEHFPVSQSRGIEGKAKGAQRTSGQGTLSSHPDRSGRTTVRQSTGQTGQQTGRKNL
jgi:hypothetical protein